jgi:myo-inositol-1(or 4)-monophosphatase
VLPLVKERRGASEVHQKAVNDIVTGTDLLVQSTLQRFLQGRHPDIAFVGEEGVAEAPPAARATWLVDPICGTSSYAAGLPLFAINVALVENGSITACAVADGGSAELYVAESGRGAWQVQDTDVRRIEVNRENRLVNIDPDNLGGTGLRDFSNTLAIEVLERRCWDVRALSSTISLVYLASGRLGGAVFSPLGAAMHFAAGALLVREAGGLATDHTGADWRLESPILVVAASPDLHREIVALAGNVFDRVNR